MAQIMDCYSHLRRKQHGKKDNKQISILADCARGLYPCCYYDSLSNWPKILSIAGDYFYGISYCHMFILWVVRKAVTLTGLNNIWIANFGLCFVLTVTRKPFICRDSKTLHL